ncbi:MAG: gliding motility-associated C-terminal domain-containing protein [Chitinophagaceae bacterium]
MGYINHSNPFYADGLITKLTGQGSVLWSKQIIAPLYRALRLTDAVALPDGNFIVTGTASIVDTVSHSVIKQWGVVFKIDQYGNFLWTKAFDNHNELLTTTSLKSIARMNDGHFILVGNIYTKPGPNNAGIKPMVLMKMDGEGNVKWRTNFSSDAGYYALTQRIGIRLVNGGNNLVLGFSLYQAEPIGFGYGRNLKEGYYLLNLNYESGQKVWDNAYLYPSKESIDLTSIGPIQHIAELPNGDLSFLFSFSDSLRHSAPPFTKRAANMITNGNGALKKVIGYFNTQYGCYIAGAMDAGATGERVVLMDDGRRLILMQIDEDGKVKWQKAYSSTNDPYGTLSFHAASTGYYIFSDDKFNPRTTNLFKTNKDGELDCIGSPVNMVTEDVTNLFSSSNTDLRFLTGTEVLRYITLETTNYELVPNILCYKTCCKDTLDIANTKQITLCEGDTYSLPNNYMVKDSGTYYITTKTAAGCDSVSFYHVAVQKNPGHLKLAGDECFEGKDTITLKATPGFEKYNWTNNITTDSSYFVTKPGVYWVGVSNSCGSKRDSTEIFDKCNFSIYMPSAFTPNDDGLNDVFRIPPSNKNKLIRLQVYNRWGQKIFETKGISKGWNGMLEGQLQPVGIYIYFLTMESLNGNKITKQGTVTLIR